MNREHTSLRAPRCTGRRATFARLWATAALLSTLAWAAPAARAYALLTTLDGAPARWASVCVPWWLQADGSRDLPLEDVYDAVSRAFATWSAVPTTYPDLPGRGTTCFRRVGLASWPGPQNVVLFDNGPGTWPHPSRVVALTTVTIDDSTGAIVDADIELNGQDFHFATDGSPAAFDLQQVVTHEAGHVLGLDHTDVANAVMYPTSDPGRDLQRLMLHPDDIQGLEASHPLALAPPDTACPPSREVTSADVAALEEPWCPARPQHGGCGAAPGPRGHATPPLWGWLVAFGVALRWTRHQRHRLRTRSARRTSRASLPRGLGAAVTTLALASFLTAGTARAYVPLMTPDGTPAFWAEDRVELEMGRDVPAAWDADEIFARLQVAANAWDQVPCAPVELDAVGLVDDAVEDVSDGRNMIVWVHDGWPYSAKLLALTSVHFDTDTGRILDADVEFNVAGKDFDPGATCSPDATSYDLAGTMTHELGHVLGLDHTPVPDATMNAVTFPGDCKKRTLARDDEDGLCATYANRPDVGDSGGDAGADAGAGDARDVGVGAPGGDGCQAAGAAPSWLALLALLGLLARATLIRRRRAAA